MELWAALILLAGLHTAVATTQILSPVGPLDAEAPVPAGSSFDQSSANNKVPAGTDERRCQKVGLPTIGGEFPGMTFLRAAIPQAGTTQAQDVGWKITLFNTTGHLLGESDMALTEGEHDPDKPETATFTTKAVVGVGDASDNEIWLCITADTGANSGTTYFSTKSNSVATFDGSGTDVPLTATGTKPAMIIALVGVPHVIYEFPFSENFDDWDNCPGVGGIPTCIHSISWGSGISFEDRACAAPFGWRNTPLGEDDDYFEWLVHTGPAHSRLTAALPSGPLHEHTNATGNLGGNYVYTETSEGCSEDLTNRVGYLETPWIIIPGGFSASLSFWYHMWGRGGMAMHVDSKHEGDSSWTLNGPNGMWYNPATDLDKNKNGGNINPGVDEWLLWDNLDLNSFSGSPPFRLRFRAVLGAAATGLADADAESDMAIDDVTFFAYTNTPTPTDTATPTGTDTSTRTETSTVIPTQTLVHTATETPTDTETPYRAYIPVGIPDANEEVVNAHWSHIRPTTCYEDEWCSLTLSGFWLGGVDEVIEAKVAYWQASCIDTAPGTHTTTIVTSCNNTAVFSVSEPGTYMVCIKHRQDWEQVRNDRLTILPKPTVNLDGRNCSVWDNTNSSACENSGGNCHWETTDNTCTSVQDLYFGFSLCSGISVSVPNSCGCWYRRSGDGLTKTQLLPYDYPTRLLPQGPNARHFSHGCCQRAHGNNIKFRTSTAEYWGYCTENALENLPSL